MGKLTHSECLTHLLICLLLAITSFSLYFQLIHYLPINSVKASSIAPDVSPTFFFKATLLECSNKICCRGTFFEKGFEPFTFSVPVWCKCSFFFDCEGSFVVSLSLLSLFFLEHMFLIVYWRVSSVFQQFLNVTLLEAPPSFCFFDFVPIIFGELLIRNHKHLDSIMICFAHCYI